MAQSKEITQRPVHHIDHCSGRVDENDPQRGTVYIDNPTKKSQDLVATDFPRIANQSHT